MRLSDAYSNRVASFAAAGREMVRSVFEDPLGLKKSEVKASVSLHTAA